MKIRKLLYETDEVLGLRHMIRYYAPLCFKTTFVTMRNNMG
ncbi:conserved hypothetical protein [Xenorhabdus nematophila F1]|uniref:Uncharacterized protein n=1 Tax=Xenorhabdus nematophila (strain ATCC 19061 / DSM 3370 / CCUG 14189 / LMG 1036 / NCIMB 9965 / AN6) TaxID=406817 RepID=D3VB32_XENNA|nr:hypothetical protein XNC1_3776 [Xenorhabdus nematophila ATCC 19061]CCW32876.1 conserved hypothetical protein [Xenorhabdus nematophila F1]CEE90563.1 hypothetical protein XNA1_1590024 [Xenorhabdus nematophila str. Anatoliense]CEF28738.1 hypothetical protein XNW1_1350023 [Xenorhabdus nematophila str. Websteri]CEK24626.1 hypothetical protein XNC2_3632 [Xenorhabdus nematophila AN6/1]